jgi:serine/threonine-protein kinase
MAPEQVALESHLINERADVWAIGVTLYELLTGEVPFTGSMSEMLTRIRSEAPPRLRARRPDVAPELEAAILRCLSKHPSDRFPNAGELAHALRELRQFGLVRSERGQARREVQTEMSAVRKAEGSMRPRAIRDTAATEQDPVQPSSRSTSPRSMPSSQRGGGKLLAITIVCVTVCALVALVFLMQGRFGR